MSWDDLEPDMELVKEMLRDPANADKRITDIAMDAGFFDISNFSETFKAETGMNPTQYRSVHTYFERVTGMSIEEYKQKHHSDNGNSS